MRERQTGAIPSHKKVPGLEQQPNVDSFAASETHAACSSASPPLWIHALTKPKPATTAWSLPLHPQLLTCTGDTDQLTLHCHEL
jgi:hypothetical protein